MNVKITENNEIRVVAIEGRLDTTNYNELESEMDKLFKSEKFNIIFDLAALQYVSSSGLRVMLMTLKRVTAAGGKFILCNMQDGIKEIFEISGFTTIFSIDNNLDEALNRF